jgi:hypothetical protein
VADADEPLSKGFDLGKVEAERAVVVLLSMVIVWRREGSNVAEVQGVSISDWAICILFTYWVRVRHAILPTT